MIFFILFYDSVKGSLSIAFYILTCVCSCIKEYWCNKKRIGPRVCIWRI